MSLATKDPDPDHRALCLQFLRDIFDVSVALATYTYIWGGMVIDILRGEFLRAHHDIDGFTLNLLDVRDEMASRFADRGYATSYADEWNILRIDKGEFHAAFNRLEITGSTAMWRHVGNQGTVFFPADWLEPEPRHFCGVDVYISGVPFEYAIKTNPQLLNPEWQPRDKDRDAVRFLNAELDRNGLDRTALLSQIWSYTPFWAQRGYPEYAAPVAAGSANLTTQLGTSLRRHN